MNPMVPAEVPSYWLVYFTVNDVDAAHRTAVEAGGTRAHAADGLPGRPDVDPERPAGRSVRTPRHRLTAQGHVWRPIASARCSASMIVIRCGKPDGASGHDRRVDDAQALDAMDPAAGVDDGAVLG